MRVFVYGTLKMGQWNNPLLGDSEFIQEHVIGGYKLYDVGFPVAIPSEGTSIRGEIWEIGNVEEVKGANILNRLDRLESNGRMYNRSIVDTVDNHPISMYIGHPDFWHADRLEACPVVNGAYEWTS